MPIHAYFGEVFLCVWPPKCSRILSRPPKGTSLAANTRFGVYIVSIGQEMRPERALKKAKKKKERKKKRNWEMWQVASLLRPSTLHYPHQSCHVGWGSGHSQPCQVSSKSVQGFWLPEGSKSAIFLCLALWLFNRLGLPPNLWSFESLDVGSLFSHMRYISREYGSSSYMKVIMSRSSRSRKPKDRKSLLPKCKISIGNNSGSIKHRGMKFACSMGVSTMAMAAISVTWPEVTMRNY